MIKSYVKQTLLIGLACGITACGGGGGGGDEQRPSSASSNAQSPSSPPPTQGSGGSGSGSGPNTGPGEAVLLSWEIPTNREDGSELLAGEIQGYEIFFYADGTPLNQGEVISIDNPSATEYTTSELSPGTYYFAISSIDNGGVYSGLSNYTSITIP